MKKIDRKVKIAGLIFALTTVFLCRDACALRVPVGSAGIYESEKEEKKREYISWLKKKMEEYGIKADEEGGGNRLARKLKYKKPSTFRMFLARRRILKQELDEIGLRFITDKQKRFSLKAEDYTEKKKNYLSTQDLDVLLVYDDNNDFKKAIIKIGSILFSMHQDRSIEYSTIECIEYNIYKVVKGIFGQIMRQPKLDIYYKVLKFKETGRIETIMSILEDTEEIKNKKDYISKLVKSEDDKLVSVIARLPKYKITADIYISDEHGIIEKDITTNGKYLLETIRKEMKAKLKVILAEIDYLEKILKEVFIYKIEEAIASLDNPTLRNVSGMLGFNNEGSFIIIAYKSGLTQEKLTAMGLKEIMDKKTLARKILEKRQPVFIIRLNEAIGNMGVNNIEEIDMNELAHNMFFKNGEILKRGVYNIGWTRVEFPEVIKIVLQLRAKDSNFLKDPNEIDKVAQKIRVMLKARLSSVQKINKWNSTDI